MILHRYRNGSNDWQMEYGLADVEEYRHISRTYLAYGKAKNVDNRRSKMNMKNKKTIT